MFARRLIKLRDLFVRKYGKVHFDDSDNPRKLEELVPKARTVLRVDGAFNNLEGPEGGIGMFVRSVGGSYRECKRVFYPDARETFKKDDCSSVIEYAALRDGIQYALELFQEQKIVAPIAVITDHLAAASNCKKKYHNMPHNIGSDTIGLTSQIVELIRVMPPHTSLLWDNGQEGRCAHYLATSCIKAGKPLKTALDNFYLKCFSFKPFVIHKFLKWTLNLCHKHGIEAGSSVLEVGTGNGVVLHCLNKLRFSEDLTGVDSSEGIIDLARESAEMHGDYNLNLLVDDILHTQLDRQFQLVLDHGTLEAMNPRVRLMYWESLATLVAQGGILVISTSEVLEMVGSGFEIIDSAHLGEEDRSAYVVACRKL